MKKIIIVLLVFFVLINLNSKELSKDSWVIYVGNFEGIELSPSNQLLTSTIPMFFRDNLDRNFIHFSNEEEFALVIDSEITSEIKNIREKKLKLLKDRDALLFKKSRTELDYEKLDKDIDNLNLDIETFKEFKLEDISMEPLFDIVIEPSDEKNYKVVTRSNIPFFLEQNKIDYYIGGELEEDEENLFLTIRLYSRYSLESEVLWSGIGESENLLGYKDEILDIILRRIVSSPLYSYRVISDPKDSLLYINGEYKGLGFYEGYGGKNDKIDIQVSKEGFKKSNLNFILNKDDFRIKVDLKPIESQSITISTIPIGAKAYYGSKYIGETPVDIIKFSYPQKLTFKLDGYNDKSITIGDNFKSRTILLDQGIVDSEEQLKNGKENFYTATAIFSVALALPLFLDGQSDDIDSVVMGVSITNAVLWGGHLFYRLYRYLEAAKFSAG